MISGDGVKIENNKLPEIENNPVGELLEVTQKFSVNQPVYEFEDSVGPSHNKVFVCHVKFSDFKEVGYGKSKKMAKRQAALKMLENLKSFAYLNQDLENLNGNENSKSKRHRSKKTSIYNSFTKLKLSTNPTISKLLDYTGNIDPFILNKVYLERLAEEETLEFKFIQIPNKYPDGNSNYKLALLLYV